MDATKIYREFKLKKINDHGKSQNRKLVLEPNMIKAMNGKKVKREFNYEELIGITFNNKGKFEFILHNSKGDLRYRWKTESERKQIIQHIHEYCEGAFVSSILEKTYWVVQDDLKYYHNTKNDYKKSHHIRIPNDSQWNPRYFLNNSMDSPDKSWSLHLNRSSTSTTRNKNIDTDYEEIK